MQVYGCRATYNEYGNEAGKRCVPVVVRRCLSYENAIEDEISETQLDASYGTVQYAIKEYLNTPCELKQSESVHEQITYSLLLPCHHAAGPRDGQAPRRGAEPDLDLVR